MIELLTIMAILGILLTLVLAGVSAVRNASRRIACGAKLHDLGIGYALFMDVNGYYPTGFSGYDPRFPGSDQLFGAPWHQLLPYLDAVAYDRLNFTEDVRVSFPANYTVQGMPMPLFVCPASPSPIFPVTSKGWFSPASYAGNAGVVSGGDKNDGVIGHFRVPVRPADIVDGTSRTAMISEWVSLPEFRPTARHRPWGYVYTPLRSCESEEVPELCDLAPTQAQPISEGGETAKGGSWLRNFNHYSHVLPPNSYDVYGLYPAEARLCAGSFHDGLVNVGFCDGHVVPVSEAIDKSVWRQLGSRHDGGPAEGY